jgi:P4 family phage/plasmid primase-like protien
MSFFPQGAEGVKSPNVSNFEEEKKKRKSGEEGDKEKKAPDPSAELLFAEFVQSHGDFRIGGRQENGDIEQSLYHWNSEHWSMMHEAVARKEALRWLKARRKHKCTQQTARSALLTAMDFMVDEPAQMLSSLEGARPADCAIIPVLGAYLRIEKEGVVRPLKPARDFGLTYTVPAAFDWARCNGDGTYTPRPVDPATAFGRYLDRFMPDPHVRRLLQEAAAASVLPTNFEVAWVLSGSGSNGKSTFLHLLRKIHPFNTSLRIKNADGRFGFQNIAGKTLVIAAEVPHFIGADAEQNLKSLISRDPIEVEKKKRDSISIVPRATLFLAMNEALKFTDYTYGNERKYQTIPFLVRMQKDSPDRVRDYHRLITDNPVEMSVVLDWILEGAVRIQQQGGFSKLPESVANYTETSRLQTDNVAAFLHETEAHHDKGAWTPKMAIYTSYKDYCLERTLKPVSEPSFWTRVREKYEREEVALGDKQVQTKNGRGRAVQLRLMGVAAVMER